MEEWQKEVILKNLEELARKTRCSEELLNQLVAGKALTSQHLQNLESQEQSEFEKSTKLYKTLLRSDSFEVLVNALEEGGQTVVVKLLLDHDVMFKNYGTVIYDGDTVLRDNGNPGKIIYEGRFGGRFVSVKAVISNISSRKAVMHEVEMLKKLDAHENILRFLTVQTNRNVINIAYEHFHSSLYDEMKSQSLNLNFNKVLIECAKGVAYLHEMDVVHTALSPFSIVVRADGKIKITDMDNAVKMKAGATKVSVSKDRVMMMDWKPPGVLRQLIKVDTQVVQMTKASDVFSMGCIFYFVVTKGAHPFGNVVLRRGNIYNTATQMAKELVEENILSLIKRMISADSSQRPSIEVVVFEVESCTQVKMESSTADGRDHKSSPARLEMDRRQVDAYQNGSSTTPRARKRLRSSSSGSSSKTQGTKKRRSSSQQIDNDVIGPANFIKEEPTDGSDMNENNSDFQSMNEDINAESSAHDTNLRTAVSNRMPMRQLASLIKMGSDMSLTDSRGMTLLHLAALRGHFQAMRQFIRLAADVNARDLQKRTPLHKVAFTRTNFRKKLRFLVDSGAKINSRDKDGNSLLSLCTRKGKSVQELKVIVTRGGHFHKANSKGKTVLHLAAEKGNFHAIRYFVSIGAKMDVMDKRGELALHRTRAIKLTKRCRKAVRTFLELGSEIDACDRNGNTLLGLAVRDGGTLPDIKFLIRKGADWKWTNKFGKSILDIARENKNEPVVKLLVAFQKKCK